MRGASKINPSGDDRLSPSQFHMYGVLCDSTDHITQRAYATYLVRAMFLLMFHAFLRIGEVTKTHTNNHDVDILESQIQQMGRRNHPLSNIISA